MAKQLTKERSTSGRAKITVKEATRAFRAALGDTPKPELLELAEDGTLERHPKGGFVVVRTAGRPGTGTVTAKATWQKQPAKKGTAAKRKRA